MIWCIVLVPEVRKYSLCNCENSLLRVLFYSDLEQTVDACRQSYHPRSHRTIRPKGEGREVINLIAHWEALVTMAVLVFWVVDNMTSYLGRNRNTINSNQIFFFCRIVVRQQLRSELLFYYISWFASLFDIRIREFSTVASVGSSQSSSSIVLSVFELDSPLQETYHRHFNFFFLQLQMEVMPPLKHLHDECWEPLEEHCLCL